MTEVKKKLPKSKCCNAALIPRDITLTLINTNAIIKVEYCFNCGKFFVGELEKVKVKYT